jgi:hypothetical protein
MGPPLAMSALIAFVGLPACDLKRCSVELVVVRTRCGVFPDVSPVGQSEPLDAMLIRNLCPDAGQPRVVVVYRGTCRTKVLRFLGCAFDVDRFGGRP